MRAYFWYFHSSFRADNKELLERRKQLEEEVAKLDMVIRDAEGDVKMKGNVLPESSGGNKNNGEAQDQGNPVKKEPPVITLDSVEEYDENKPMELNTDSEADLDDDSEDPVILKKGKSLGKSPNMGPRTVRFWKANGSRPVSIVSYGPRNAKIWRRETGESRPEGAENISDPMTRRGEMHSYDENGKKTWDWNDSDVAGIVGVALPADTRNVLDAVDPDKRLPTTKLVDDPDNPGHKMQKTIGARYKPIEVLIKWTDGAVTAETRAVCERVWQRKKKEVTAIAIFEAAQTQETRNKEVETGKRQAKDASPTPDPTILDNLRNGKSATPERSTGQNLAVPGKKTPPAESGKNGESEGKGKGKGKEAGPITKEEEAELKEQAEQIRQEYAMAVGKRFSDLTLKEKMDVGKEIRKMIPRMALLSQG